MRSNYSTRGFAGDRAALWRSVIREVYAHLDLDVLCDQKFSGDLTRTRLGQVEVTDVRADSEMARRTTRHIASFAVDSCIFLLVKSGELRVSQFGRSCVVPAGHYALLNLDEPYEFSHHARVHKIGLKLPQSLLRRRASDLADRCATVHSATSGVARIATDYIASLSEHCGEVAPEQSHLLSRTVCDLVFLTIEANGKAAFADESAVRAAIRRRACAFIEANCASAGLSPASIARGINVSTRYLHQCFESAEYSVMQQVRASRLQQVLADLRDPSLRSVAIRQVAFRNGFQNVCHFNEAFKAQFGVTPRQARAAAGN
jgi:AraC-like DNA-binding protein